MGRAPGASLQEEDPDRGGVAAAHYVNNAVKQWRRDKRLRACVAANGGYFEHPL